MSISKIISVSMTMLVFSTTAFSAEKIKILIIDGQNNHNWPVMTKYLTKVLDKAGMFEVTVSTTPPQEKRKHWDTRGPYTEEERISTEKAWTVWRPAFEGQDVVFLVFNGQYWPEEVMASSTSEGDPRCRSFIPFPNPRHRGFVFLVGWGMFITKLVAIFVKHFLQL